MTALLLAAATAAAKAAPAALKAGAVKAKALPVQIQQPVNQAPIVAPQHMTWFQLHMAWLTHGIAGVFLLSAISLIVLLAAQTTKQEGLSGTLGGRVESAYGRPGMEEQLKRVTGLAATFFVVCGTILALTGI
ncbi:MAG: preprotein translocase subunit SecG [Candidatus Baltobacteraceae bacterium]